MRAAMLGTCALLAWMPTVAVAGPAPAPPAPPAPAPAPAPASTDGSASTTASAPSDNQVQPMYGNLKAFYGNLKAFDGGIDPFYGNLKAFYGNLKAFSGDLSPFYGNLKAFYGGVDPFYGNLKAFTGTDSSSGGTAQAGPLPVGDAFWGTGSNVPYNASGVSKTGITFSQINPFWTTEAQNWINVQSAWSTAQTAADYGALAQQIKSTVLDPASAFWDNAITKSGPGATAAAAAYRATLFANAGITFNADGSLNAASLQGVTPAQQMKLFSGLYDSYMGYTGAGRVDWWMGPVGWSPALAQIQDATGPGASLPTVGMIDFAVSNGQHLSKQVTSYGSTVFSNGHGAAVASLIIGATDGSGVLGVLPANAAKVVVYDPYDSTNTTNWTDVGTGVATLTSLIFPAKGPAGMAPVGVLNASLGVPGWTLHPGWNDALANAGAAGHDLVIAAGNEGVTQTQNVSWNFANNPTILLVGSVGVTGQISPFSNTPGEACLLDTASTSTVCTEANKLKYRFIVAPGEFILVSDGQGGFSRQSGTSLAAPLVSGTIAMLQNRWPWLANYPNETAQIILKSATPLGANPGADPVYGVGELNIKAAQSPLNWNNLQYYSAAGGKVSATATPVTQALMQIRGGTQSTWDTGNISYTVLEKIGATYRDFQIPLGSKLIGQNAQTGGGAQLYQSYLTSALLAQAGHFAPASGFASDRFGLGMTSSGVSMGEMLGARFQLSMSPREQDEGFKNRSTPYQVHGVLAGERNSFEFGVGEGAAVLIGQSGFGFHSDHSLRQGGADPLLGLASGGAYLNTNVGLTPRLTVSIGGTERRDVRNLALFGLSPLDGASVRTYSAQAGQVAARLALSDKVAVRAAVTNLHENAAALGVQSLDPADLRGGSDTTGMTLGFDTALPWNLSLSGSGTVGSTHLGDGQIRTSGTGLVSTAAELALTKSRLFGKGDSLRLALSKPLHIDGGTLRYDTVGVINRQTGELGVVSQPFAPVTGRTPIAGELMYGKTVGRGEFSLFSRATANPAQTNQALDLLGGAQVRMAF